MKKNWPILLGLLIFMSTMFYINKRAFTYELPTNTVLLDGVFDIPDTNQDSTYNPTNCKFQPPLATREPSLYGIHWVPQQPDGYINYSWDNTFIGLHRTNLSGWPGLDYLQPTTIAFKNGGIVDKVGYDNKGGGGHSLYIKGFGVCEGWYIYIGHLNYDPTMRYSPGDFIGPNEIIGDPGCSGFEDRCWTGDPTKIPLDKSWQHNHYSLGYKDNIFKFDDGTEIAFQAGYYWVSLIRMEDTATNLEIIAPPPAVIYAEETPSSP